MDLFLLEGYTALIRICLALLKCIESKCYIFEFILEELCQLPYEECLVYLKSFGKTLECDLD